MDTQEKVRENYYRRMAKRLGLMVQKSKAKKWHIHDYGQYWIIDPYTNTIICGENHDMSLDDVAKFLKQDEKKISHS